MVERGVTSSEWDVCVRAYLRECVQRDEVTHFQITGFHRLDKGSERRGESGKFVSVVNIDNRCMRIRLSVPRRGH